jgi:hypothetical protein
MRRWPASRRSRSCSRRFHTTWFVNAFLEAMKSKPYLPVAVVLLAAVVTVLLRRQAPMPAGARGAAAATADRANASRSAI